MSGSPSVLGWSHPLKGCHPHRNLPKVVPVLADHRPAPPAQPLPLGVCKEEQR